MISKAQNDKLVKARYKLFQKQPFLWNLVNYLKMRPAKDIPTMAVDIFGNLYCNMEFYDKCSVDDLTWILAHEVFHIVTATHKRFPVGANHMLWNIASDISINQIITDKANIPLPASLHPLYGKEFDKYKDWTTEKIYADLLKTVKQQKGDGSGNGFSGDENDPHAKKGPFKGKWWDDSGSKVGEKATGEKAQEAAQQWKQRISSAKQAGKITGDLADWLGEILRPQRDWKKELRQKVQTTLRRRATWQRPGRRTIGLGIRTPAKKKEIFSCVVYLDTSGSMSDDQLKVCISEAASICENSGGKIRLILGDSEIYYDGEVENSNLTSLKMRRGGTDFTVLFDHIAKSEKDKPKILIGFTDAYGPFPASPPDYPVVWTTLRGVSAVPPWGHHIEVDTL